jgi:hypothetical protein
MWHTITTDGKCPAKKIGRRCQLTAVVLLLFAVVMPAPSSYGRTGGLTLDIHQLIPAGVPSLVAAGLVLAACYWLFRSPEV